MELNQFNEFAVQSQALAAGFATVELYIQSLLERDADRLAVKKALTRSMLGITARSKNSTASFKLKTV